MRTIKLLSLIGLFILVLSFSSLSAAVVQAHYQEETDTTIHNCSDFGIQGIGGINVALHVGTLTITPTVQGSNPMLYAIQLDRSGNWGGGSEYWLLSSKSINYQTRFGAQLIAKVRFGTKTIVKIINYTSGMDPLMGSSEFTGQYPIIIDFYLGIRNINNAAQTVGAEFLFEGTNGPNLGNFNINYKNADTWNSPLISIPFTDTPSNTPFFSGNYNEGTTDSPLNTEADKSIYVSFAVEQTPAERTIDLGQAVGAARARVGQARLTLSGYNSGSAQGVSLTFTDNNGSSNFRLKHENTASYIPFSLFLDGQAVSKGTPISWGNLTFGPNNVKELKVGAITNQAIASSLAGTYSDTITVTIMPLDSNLTGF